MFFCNAVEYKKCTWTERLPYQDMWISFRVYLIVIRVHAFQTNYKSVDKCRRLKHVKAKHKQYEIIIKCNKTCTT